MEPATAITNPFEGRAEPPLEPIELDGELEYKVMEILSSRLDQRRWEPLMYLVKWAGYEGTDKETSWVPAANLEHAPELISEFHCQYPEMPGTSDRD
jgi:hypothetical protein